MGAVSAKRSSIKAFNKYNSALVGNAFTEPYTANFEHIATVSLSANQASVSFTNLGVVAAPYKHLQIRYVAVSTQANWCSIRFNSDSGASYSGHFLHGNGSSVTSSSIGSSQVQMGMMFIAGGTSPACGIIDITDAMSSTKNKTVRSLHGYAETGPEVVLSSGAWLSTTQLSSIQLIHGSTVFSANSRFSLYGTRG